MPVLFISPSRGFMQYFYLVKQLLYEQYGQSAIIL
jgi:hypothetical protein